MRVKVLSTMGFQRAILTMLSLFDIVNLLELAAALAAASSKSFSSELRGFATGFGANTIHGCYLCGCSGPQKC
ncbi:protein of unknown function [Magnetospirillum sp. XM-1]|nr:protein of unknown function [Magnetospirillum sp. XM-1]